MNWEALLGIGAVMMLSFILYRTVRNSPEMLSAHNLSKSLGTLGFLALGLMAFIGLLVLSLR